MSKEFRVYLSGPMANCDDEEMLAWRAYCKEHLFAVCLDPSRRDYRKGNWPSVEELVLNDKKDIDESDFVFVYYLKPSTGTAMEQLYAWERNKHVWLIRHEGVMPSPWSIYHATEEFSSLLDAVKAFNSRYGIDYVA